MSTAKVINQHIHSYKKSSVKNEDWRKQIYKCKDPRCKSYAPAHLIEGKECRCAKCDMLTLVTKTQLYKGNRLIVCVMCSRSPKKFKLIEDQKIYAGVLDDIFGIDEPETESNYDELESESD